MHVRTSTLLLFSTDKYFQLCLFLSFARSFFFLGGAGGGVSSYTFILLSCVEEYFAFATTKN